MKVLRILGVIVGLGFILLLIVGFDNVLELFRSRVALFLLLGPLVGLFLWSLYRAFTPPKNPRTYIDLPPREP
jgi:hypothetical protein